MPVWSGDRYVGVQGCLITGVDRNRCNLHLVLGPARNRLRCTDSGGGVGGKQDRLKLPLHQWNIFKTSYYYMYNDTQVEI